MSDIAVYRLDNNDEIHIEFIEPMGEGYEKIARRDEKQDEVPRFTTALERIKPAAEQVIKQFSALSVQPDEVELGFGIKFSGSVGAIIASTKTDANFSVKVKWKPAQ